MLGLSLNCKRVPSGVCYNQERMVEGHRDLGLAVLQLDRATRRVRYRLADKRAEALLEEGICGLETDIRETISVYVAAVAAEGIDQDTDVADTIRVVIIRPLPVDSVNGIT